jgi:hypothetical protein
MPVFEVAALLETPRKTTGLPALSLHSMGARAQMPTEFHAIGWRGDCIVPGIELPGASITVLVGLPAKLLGWRRITQRRQKSHARHRTG